MIKKVIVLGSGSAGLLAALSLKRRIPELEVRIVRDPDLGVIGVGEGTTPNFPEHLFNYLGIKRKAFYRMAEPTWKLGIRFLWGPRKRFDYSFATQLDMQLEGMKMPNGFYCDEKFVNTELTSALMREGNAFPRQAGQAPDIQPWHAFHIENHKLVETLEVVALEMGVIITDGKMTGAECGPEGISAVHLGDGQRLEADFFIDASGFASELIGKALEEPFESFDKTLFCDRAVVGGWDRTIEPVLPYTTAETMDSGWSWQIEHEHFINRGYVYCSDMISDEQAAEEFQRKNPKAPASPRVVKFRSGCYRRMWIGNVVAIGNSGGFVEPLEATALMVVCSHCQNLVAMLIQSQLNPTDSIRTLYNDVTGSTWREIRDFLGLHYKLNTSDDTPFWRRCQEETDLSGIRELLDFYAENGPTGFARQRMPTSLSDFGWEGYLVMLVGNQAPYRNRYQPTLLERNAWEKRRAEYAIHAKHGISVQESLSYIRHPAWKWNADD